MTTPPSIPLATPRSPIPAPLQTAAPNGRPPAPIPSPSQIRAARLEISYISAAGFEHTLILEGESGQALIELAHAVDKQLLSRNCKARAASAPATAPAPASAGQGAAPKCKYHGGVMKLGKGGKYFCPKKVDGGYCDYTVAE